MRTECSCIFYRKVARLHSVRLNSSILAYRSRDRPYCSSAVVSRYSYTVAISHSGYMGCATLLSSVINQDWCLSTLRPRRYCPLILVLSDSALDVLYLVCVFDSQDKLAIQLAGEQVVKEGSPEATNVHEACGGWSIANSDREQMDHADQKAITRRLLRYSSKHYKLL